MSWTTTTLLQRIRLYSRIADGHPDFTDAVLLTLADDAIITRFSDVVTSLREQHWLTSYDFTVSSSATYPLPPRAIAESLTDVVLLDAGGHPATLVGPLETAEVEYYDSTTPAFYVLDRALYLRPAQSSGTLRVRFALRRSTLILSTSAAVISSINTGTNTVTCADVPASWTNSTLLDLIQVEPSGTVLAMDQDPVAVTTGASGTVQLTGLPTGLAVGDYLAPRTQSPVLQLPPEMAPALANFVAGDVLSQLGDSAGARERLGLADAQLASAKTMLTPRVHNKPQRLRAQGLFRRA